MVRIEDSATFPRLVSARPSWLSNGLTAKIAMIQDMTGLLAREVEGSRVVLNGLGPLSLGLEDSAAIVKGVRILAQTECVR